MCTYEKPACCSRVQLRKARFTSQRFIIYMYVCMYVYKYNADIHLLCMIKFRVRWCTCSMWRMLLPCGKLIGLFLFCLLFLLSILFFKPTYVYKTSSRTELDRLVMGTIFLVVLTTLEWWEMGVVITEQTSMWIFHSQYKQFVTRCM